MRASRICRSSRRTATPTRAGIAEDEPFPDPATLFVVPDHYIFRMLYSQGIDLDALGIPPAAGETAELRPARGLAALRGELSSLPRHAEPHVARPRLRDALRLQGAALRRRRRFLFRPDRGGARDAGVPSARALRALQHRGDRHDRQPARSARRARRRSGNPTGTAASSRPIGPTRSSIRTSRTSPPISCSFATSPTATR